MGQSGHVPLKAPHPAPVCQFKQQQQQQKNAMQVLTEREGSEKWRENVSMHHC